MKVTPRRMTLRVPLWNRMVHPFASAASVFGVSGQRSRVLGTPSPSLSRSSAITMVQPFASRDTCWCVGAAIPAVRNVVAIGVPLHEAAAGIDRIAGWSIGTLVGGIRHAVLIVVPLA